MVAKVIRSLVLGVLLALFACPVFAQGETETPTPTATSTETPMPTATVAPTPTLSVGVSGAAVVYWFEWWRGLELLWALPFGFAIVVWVIWLLKRGAH